MRLSMGRLGMGRLGMGRLGTGRLPTLRRTTERGWWGGEPGSMAAEFTVAAPALALLLLLVSAGGQWVSVTGQVGGAARDAARAASVARSASAAQAQAQFAAGQDLAGLCSGSPAGHPEVTVTPVSGGQAGPFATAAAVQVAVACDVRLAAFRLVGFSGEQTFTATGVAPLDSFVCRSGTC